MAERSDKLQQLVDGLMSQERLSKIGLGAERLIRVRTRKGMDVEGRDFPSAENNVDGSPYSRGWYVKRKAKGWTVDKKNLEFTPQGGMLAQMTHRILAGADPSAELYFQGDRAKKLARYHNKKGVGINKMLHVFFGLNDEDRVKIAGLYQDDINDLISDLGLSV